MDDLMRVATAHGLAIVEDNAHGLLGRYKGRPLGSFGAMSTLSFHETKNISCGEGGALILNDAALAERAEIIREKGTDRSKFFRGQVDKYSWVDVGSSYPPSDMLAAFLFAQLEARDTIQAARGRVWRRYDEELRTWATAHDIRQPIVPDGCEHPFHLYYLLLPSLEWRQALIDHLKRRQILAVFHYVPLHLSTMGQRFGARPRDCPVAESVGDRLVRLPLFVGLTDDEQSRVIDAILAFDGP
jgi:dTDP-4-amino-4,6-dideoxygalactose transaminase